MDDMRNTGILGLKAPEVRGDEIARIAHEGGDYRLTLDGIILYVSDAGTGECIAAANTLLWFQPNWRWYGEYRLKPIEWTGALGDKVCQAIRPYRE
ncbi:hypothetical protein [Salininema proteolyticum]|uniref:Uncharacterized protein n=1 Tax=Salininema proteolyticum TaxID=1607685 RepID=A0ABV8TX32_9ACTN